MNRILHIQTPTGGIAVLRPMAEKLLAEGIITGTIEGQLHAADAVMLKAAVMAGGICDFCAAPGAEHVFNVPDFDMPNDTGTSVGGWAACGECAVLVDGRKRKELLTRSCAGMAFPKFSRMAIEELHNRFWSHMDQAVESTGIAASIVAWVDDRLPYVTSTPTDRDKRIEAIMRVSGLTLDEMQSIIRVVGNFDNATDSLNGLSPSVMVKIAKWRKTFGKLDAQKLGELLNGTRKPLAYHVPHWQQALDGKFSVVKVLQRFMNAEERVETFAAGIDLNDKDMMQALIDMAEARQNLKNLGFKEDLRMLPGAQVYSFNEETAAAITEASKGIPHESPLSAIETPNSGSGWFWFSEPLNVAASPMASKRTQALLWGWVVKEDNTNPALLFSAYVRDENGTIEQDILLPSTRWYWPLHMSFHDMLKYNSASWEETYGPGTQMANDPIVQPREATLKIVAELSLYFVMSCLWFKQTVSTAPILTKEKAHIERHARKRIQKEFKLEEPPIVQVVALRRSARTPAESAPSERVDGAREYHCRWIVIGHPRLQACGPGRKDRKLIWIESHPAGPEDKPLRTKTKVYAVVR